MSEKLEEKLYAEQNPIKLGKYYTDHVMAMTAENLHSKADIAKQLAWRDKKLDAQAEELAALRETYKYLIAEQSTRVMSDAVITHILIQGGIIDENGKPTKLLTGEE